MPGVPLELFKKGILLRMGSKLGKAVRVDLTTMIVFQGKFACIFVEIELLHPLNQNLHILKHMQTLNTKDCI